MTDEPVLTLSGERVALGPVTRAALPLMQRWQNDPKIMMTLAGQVWPVTEKDQQEWFEKYALRGDGSQVHFLGYRLADLQPIGHLNLFAINYRNQSAFAGGFIGEKRFWGRDYALEASLLLLRYAFDVLGLHNVTTSIHADNRGSLRVANLAGFRELGRQRDGARKGQGYVDMVFLDILASDLEDKR